MDNNICQHNYIFEREFDTKEEFWNEGACYTKRCETVHKVIYKCEKCNDLKVIR